MWFEHNDMDDLERLLHEQKEKDEKVNVKLIDLCIFNSLFSSLFPHLLAALLAYFFECRPKGSCVLKVSVVRCQSIPLINTLDRPSIDTTLTSRLTLD